jgi:hypothetical protein
LGGMVLNSRTKLQTLADFSRDTSVLVNQKNLADATQILADLQLSFQSPYRQMTASELQMESDFKDVADLLANATLEYGNTQDALRWLKGNATQVAIDYVDTNGPIDLQAKSDELVLKLNNTAVNSHLTDLTKKYDDALNFPVTGLRANLTESLRAEIAKMRTMENNFETNSSIIRANALDLLPAQVFQGMVTNLTNSESLLTNAEISFHNNLILALASASHAVLSSSTASTKSRDDFADSWTRLRNFLRLVQPVSVNKSSKHSQGLMSTQRTRLRQLLSRWLVVPQTF